MIASLMNVKQLIEWRLAGETEEFREHPSHCHLVHDKYHMTWHGIESGPSRWEAGNYSSELRQGKWNKVSYYMRRKLITECFKNLAIRKLADTKTDEWRAPLPNDKLPDLYRSFRTMTSRSGACVWTLKFNKILGPVNSSDFVMLET
jgi:hypothetical protein